MSDSRLRRAKEIQESIREVLFHDWDPIGIQEMAPHDEYDSYIGLVYRILATSRSEEELIRLLDKLGQETIGVPQEPHSHLKQVAQKLLAIDIRLST